MAFSHMPSRILNTNHSVTDFCWKSNMQTHKNNKKSDLRMHKRYSGKMVTLFNLWLSKRNRDNTTNPKRCSAFFIAISRPCPGWVWDTRLPAAIVWARKKNV